MEKSIAHLLPINPKPPAEDTVIYSNYRSSLYDDDDPDLVDYSDSPISDRFIPAEEEFDETDFYLESPADVQARRDKRAEALGTISSSTAKGAPTPAAISISNSKAKRADALLAGRGSTDYHYPSAHWIIQWIHLTLRSLSRPKGMFHISWTI